MTVTTELVVFVISVLGVVAGAWWRVEQAIATARADMSASIAAAKSEASHQVSAASALASLLQVQLAEHKLHVAETYTTKSGVRETMAPMMDSINGIAERMDKMNERLDRAFDQPARRQSTPRREGA
ncbi:MAG: hypothetical protein H0W39_00935 [Sphingomonas sp.]|nr:hypothetical protein [Sphingomonas sp.]